MHSPVQTLSSLFLVGLTLLRPTLTAPTTPAQSSGLQPAHSASTPSKNSSVSVSGANFTISKAQALVHEGFGFPGSPTVERDFLVQLSDQKGGQPKANITWTVAYKLYYDTKNGITINGWIADAHNFPLDFEFNYLNVTGNATTQTGDAEASFVYFYADKSYLLFHLKWFESFTKDAVTLYNRDQWVAQGLYVYDNGTKRLDLNGYFNAFYNVTATQ